MLTRIIVIVLVAGAWLRPGGASAQVGGTVVVRTVAGASAIGAADGAGTAARFSFPWNLAIDSAGTVYVADSGNNTIRKITPAGVVSTLTGLAGSPGSADGTGSAARFSNPNGIAVDTAGTVYVADTSNSTIRKITPAGVVSTLAGLAGSSGAADGTGSDARFRGPNGLAVDSTGTVYVADSGNRTIRVITPAGVVSTLAGLAGSSGSTDATASAARFRSPNGIAVDAAGMLYVADQSNHTIRKITPAGVVTTLAGLAQSPGTTDGTGSAARFRGPWGVTVDVAGTVYVADSTNNRIRAITPAGVVSTLAGAPQTGSLDGAVQVARLNFPVGIAVDGAGALFIGDSNNHTIRRLAAGAVTTLAGLTGSFGSADGARAVARFAAPTGVAVDSAGTIYVADPVNATVRRIATTGTVTTLAGLAESFGLVDGTGSAARFNVPAAVTVDSGGVVYVADGNAIRRITPAGVVTTLAGAVASGSADGTATAARFAGPRGLAVDVAGNVYVADTNNNTIRRITPAGVVTTSAGLAGSAGSTDGPAASARFRSPNGIAVDAAGTIYVADTGNATVRTITTAAVVSTLAGQAGSTGTADGTGAAARFGGLVAIAVDSGGLLYTGETSNSTVRRITQAGVVTTIAGLAPSFGSADGVGSDARFAFPFGVAVDTSGVVYVADTSNNTIRALDATPTFTTQPAAQSVGAGQTATFTVVTTGAPAPAVQWQSSTNGGVTWTNLTNTAPYSGVTTTTLTITAASVSLSLTQYRAVATNSVGSATSNAATLTVVPPPTMALDHTSLFFAGIGGPGSIDQTFQQNVRIVQSGPGTVTWTATSNQPWLFVTPASGTGAGLLGIAITTNNPVLPVSGTATGAITVTFTGAANPTATIAVQLTIKPFGSPIAAPFGAFDTPAEGATGLTGSIAVTGWALSELEVARVQILRDPVPGEPLVAGQSLVFIGTAVLVDGARPDVATANPTAPRNTRAGWGYLLLTNFLPNQGDGTYTLHAIAEDPFGRRTELGTRTITCSNSSAIKPFGAIDTPGQGDVIGGGAFANFGWVLARGTVRADPPSGGAVNVFVDGAQVGSPIGWASRADLTSLFPATQFSGVASALGVFSLDTTTLSNGVHTIFWIATATNGQADGVGSRFFTVANSGLLLDPRPPGLNRAGAAAKTSVSLDAPPLMSAIQPGGGMLDARSLEDLVRGAPLDRTPVLGRRGFVLDAALAPLGSNAGGAAVLVGEELDRFEIQLRESVSDESRYTGYMRVGTTLGPLPIGSRLDVETGTFTWQPGVGFVHDYDLVFVRWVDGRAVARHDVRIAISPQGSNRVGPQIIVDAPAANASVSQPFDVAGWAIDSAGYDTGIDTLHVWAYPTCDVPRATCHRDPIFLGATAYGGARPDVATVFGDRFGPSGYSIRVESLPAGTYDLAVFAWSNAAQAFLPAKVVRVTVR